ncbi:MAG TPA: hypothetical protein VFY26_07960 [Anaerolineales bacterium]|nr:hypothetical protein [Anaerolineales bacterium]
MPKKFYTEKDIEDLFQTGQKSLQVSDDVVLTELAYEKAKRLGMQVVSDRAENPPAAPVRPYLSDAPAAARPKPAAVPAAQSVPQPNEALPRIPPIEQRIRSAVLAKLGDQVDARLLDNIIHRVVKGLGMK